MGKTLLYGLGKGEKMCKFNTKSCPTLLLAFFHLALFQLWKGGPALLEIFLAVNWLLCLFCEPVKSRTCKAWWITRESQPWIICTPFIHVSDQVQRWQEKHGVSIRTMHTWYSKGNSINCRNYGQTIGVNGTAIPWQHSAGTTNGKSSQLWQESRYKYILHTKRCVPHSEHRFSAPSSELCQI